METAAGISSRQALLTDLLKDVSRSFYLTLRVLPASIRPQIGLAYLLARTSDTIADTKVLPLDERLGVLQQFRQRVLGLSDMQLEVGRLAGQQSSRSEQLLLERAEESLTLLQTLAPEDLKMVRQVLDTILSGQELDLRRFANASEKNVVALRTEQELDDYTYRVAGCVGEFWTGMCLAHAFPWARLQESALMTQSVRFGKGLQLVNILRDLAVDLRAGRCYFPEEQLVTAGLTASDLLESGTEPRFRPAYNSYLAKAEEHLLAGWAYTNALPRRSIRVRLACAWPILIGLRTIELLRAGNVLDPQQRIKISRPEVRKLIFRSLLCYPWPGAWRRLVMTSVA